MNAWILIKFTHIIIIANQLIINLIVWKQIRNVMSYNKIHTVILKHMIIFAQFLLKILLLVQCLKLDLHIRFPQVNIIIWTQLSVQFLTKTMENVKHITEDFYQLKMQDIQYSLKISLTLIKFYKNNLIQLKLFAKKIINSLL